MHLKGLDLNLIVVLDALLTEKSTTRAGQRLFLSQSGTSGALSRLREYFGDQLLVPSRNGMVLTPFAEMLKAPISDILTAAEMLIGTVSKFDPATSTRCFRINMSDITAAMFLANTLPQLREQAPGVQVEITTIEKVQEMIEQGEMDFSEIPEIFASPLHPWELLFEDEYVCIGWSKNKRLNNDLSLEDFLSMGHVTVRMQRGMEHLGEHLLGKESARLRFDLIVPTFGMVPYSVINTDLVAFLNARLARHYVRHLPIKIFPSPLKTNSVRMVLQWHRYSGGNPGHQWMKNLLLSTLRAEGGDSAAPNG